MGDGQEFTDEETERMFKIFEEDIQKKIILRERDKKRAIDYSRRSVRKIEKLKISKFELSKNPNGEPQVYVFFEYENIKFLVNIEEEFSSYGLVHGSFSKEKEFENLKDKIVSSDEFGNVTSASILINQFLQEACDKKDPDFKKEMDSFSKNKEVIEAVRNHHKNQIKSLIRKVDLTKKELNEIHDEAVTEQVVES